MNGLIYFISDGGQAIKIGYSANPEGRINDLSTASARKISMIGTVPGSVAQERALHKMLFKHRMNGEWFHDCKEVRETINNVLSGELTLDSIPINTWPRNKVVNQLDSPVIEAQTLARLLVKYSKATSHNNFASLDKQWGLPLRTIWSLYYRPSNTLSMTTYLTLQHATKMAIERFRSELDADAEFVDRVIAFHDAIPFRMDYMKSELKILAEELSQLHGPTHELVIAAKALLGTEDRDF